MKKDKKDYMISPIPYMGNKYRLIQKGLIELFPKDIEVFWDIFSGSGVVALNVKSNGTVINDHNRQLVSMQEMFAKEKPDQILEKLWAIIKEYDLPTISTDNRTPGFISEYREKSKANYNKLRLDYNKTKDDPYKLYLLCLLTMSHMMRFNSSGDFNMPFGVGYLNESFTNAIIKSCEVFSGFEIFSEDYFDLVTRSLRSGVILPGDFIYIDPPYFNTTAVYNEGSGWTMEDENKLMQLCDLLDDNNIKFGMSNVLSHNGKENNHLSEWISRRGLHVFNFNGFGYTSNGLGLTESKEVFISNYNTDLI